MLIFDVADDFFDHVFDGDETFGTAELVDDDCEMDALVPHSREQLDHAHGFRARRKDRA